MDITQRGKQVGLAQPTFFPCICMCGMLACVLACVCTCVCVYTGTQSRERMSPCLLYALYTEVRSLTCQSISPAFSRDPFSLPPQHWRSIWSAHKSSIL